tara:strand:- start:530 stop:1321 length:792 start_codon:yes stop_codon:yes gene_type:complete
MIPYPEVTSLFKYMPWLGFARETLLEQKIWYSSMSAFNDPFEGIYDIQNDLSVHAAIALAAKYKADCHWDEVEEFIRAQVLHPRHDSLVLSDGFKAIVKQQVEEARKQIRSLGVLSLSMVSDSILLWSHYADEHRGICIEFERNIDEDSGILENSRPVIYSDMYPTPSVDQLVLDPRALTNKVVYTKSHHWAYEREWRLWKDKGNQKHPLPGPVKSVILGSNWQGSQEDIQRICRDLNADLVQAKIVKGRYDIEFETIQHRET